MKFMRIVAALAAPLLLTGCLLSPGKFSSTLDLKRDAASPSPMSARSW